MLATTQRIEIRNTIAIQFLTLKNKNDMAQKNTISAVLSPEEKAAALLQITGIKQQLNAVLQFHLTPEDRRDMVKMGDKSLAFVGKALEYATSNAHLVPAYLNMEEAQKDYELAIALHEILRDLEVLATSLEDTIMVAGSEAFDAALVFYTSVKAAARTNTPGVQSVYEDLVLRFPRGRRRQIKPENAKS